MNCGVLNIWSLSTAARVTESANPAIRLCQPNPRSNQASRPSRHQRQKAFQIQRGLIVKACKRDESNGKTMREYLFSELQGHIKIEFMLHEDQTNG